MISNPGHTGRTIKSGRNDVGKALKIVEAAMTEARTKTERQRAILTETAAGSNHGRHALRETGVDEMFKAGDVIADAGSPTGFPIARIKEIKRHTSAGCTVLFDLIDDPDEPNWGEPDWKSWMEHNDSLGWHAIIVDGDGELPFVKVEMPIESAAHNNHNDHGAGRTALTEWGKFEKNDYVALVADKDTPQAGKAIGSIAGVVDDPETGDKKYRVLLTPNARKRPEWAGQVEVPFSAFELEAPAEGEKQFVGQGAETFEECWAKWQEMSPKEKKKEKDYMLNQLRNDVVLVIYRKKDNGRSKPMRLTLDPKLFSYTPKKQLSPEEKAAKAAEEEANLDTILAWNLDSSRDVAWVRFFMCSVITFTPEKMMGGKRKAEGMEDHAGALAEAPVKYRVPAGWKAVPKRLHNRAFEVFDAGEASELVFDLRSGEQSWGARALLSSDGSTVSWQMEPGVDTEGSHKFDTTRLAAKMAVKKGMLDGDGVPVATGIKTMYMRVGDLEAVKQYDAKLQSANAESAAATSSSFAESVFAEPEPAADPMRALAEAGFDALPDLLKKKS